MAAEPLFRVKFRDADTAKVLRLSVMKALGDIEGVGRITFLKDDQSQSIIELLAWPESKRKRSTPPPPGIDEDEEGALFMEDTCPATFSPCEIPAYDSTFTTLDNKVDNSETETALKPPTRSQECFNCEGNHTLRECQFPKDMAKINQRRKDMKAKPARYHTDETIQNNALPGRISKKLRSALGLEKNQLPLHIYRMRTLGYPPGWLLHAKISHSGIAMFDSSGKAVESDDENKSTCAKDEYDIKKILDFPGFNVKHGSRYTDESDSLGFPSYDEKNSKMVMLEKLAPRAAKAYRRRKMKAIQPQLHPGDVQMETDMDIDDDEYDYLSNGHEDSNSFVPPLPTKDLPPPPPTELPALPPLPPLPEDLPPLPSLDIKSSPMPETPVKSSPTENNIASECKSPTLEDLESQKLSLLAELEEKNDSSVTENLQSSCDEKDISICDSPNDGKKENGTISANLDDSITPNTCSTPMTTPKQGRVRESTLGTPMLSLTPYDNLPTDVNFSKDMYDVINFENLPNSTGKYVQMSGLIKKVREEISKLQDS